MLPALKNIISQRLLSKQPCPVKDGGREREGREGGRRGREGGEGGREEREGGGGGQISPFCLVHLTQEVSLPVSTIQWSIRRVWHT